MVDMQVIDERTFQAASRTRRPEELRVDDLEEFYERYKKTWNEFPRNGLRTDGELLKVAEA